MPFHAKADDGARLIRLWSTLAVATLALTSCADVSLAHGLGRSAAPAPVDARRTGCRLNVATHAATCPCGTALDVEELPDRPDLESLDVELDDGVDAEKLARLSHLHALTLRNVTAEQLARVALLPQIDMLIVSTRSTLDLAQIASMTRLRSLSIALGGTARVCDVTPLAKLTSLEHLTLALNCDHDIDAAPLSSIASLHDVKLDGERASPGSTCR